MSAAAVRRLVVLLAIAAVLAFFFWRSTRPEVVPVVLGDVDRGRVERSVANTRAGTVNACRRAKLAPPAGGQIAALRVREGDRVREGQVLLELWNEDSAAQARVADEQSRSAVLRVEEACVRADTAEREAERARKMHRDGLLPDDQLDRAVSSAKTLRSVCDAARADVKQSQARVQLARATLTRTVLRAPFDGVVAKVTGEVGEFTTPSPPGIPTPPAIDLIDDSCAYITAPIDEVDVARVRVGQPAYVTIDALPGRRLPGRVRRVAPYVVDLEKQARTVDVEVELTNREDVKTLLVGYSADVEIILDARDDALRVPTEALLDGNRVLVFAPKTGVLEERKVEPGIANWKFTEVRSGVQAGEKVVLSVERKGVAAGVKAMPETPRTR
ncbi:MAG TPA: efflux RND transporter periplasmic adaptor subunit [Thermoanaerobaculia bacterium]|nr:efflux RND transporter periplasmic adaptor subunit [Thermoanaerobaculia bacterium]